MALPNLFIRLSHTGVFQGGRPNAGPVLIPDLDVGYEYQNRKVAVYVPHGGHVDIVASSRSMLAYQEGGAIRKAVDAGLITATLFWQPEAYTTVGLPPATQYPVGAMVWNTTQDSPNYSNGVSWVYGAAPTGPAGGDLAGTYPDPTVVGIQNRPVLNTTPNKGDVYVWSGTQWVSSTLAVGGGSTGQVYFFCEPDAGEPPITGLPAGTKELDPLAHIVGTTLTSGALAPALAYVAGYVTNVGNPGVGIIPTGLWTFRIWAEASTLVPGDTSIAFDIYSYDDPAAPVLLGTTGSVALYLPDTLTQYSISTVIPYTVISLTTRLYIVVKAASVSGGTITLHYGDSTPTFVQTTLSTISGTGIPHVINGIVQASATPIVDGDVAAANKDGLAAVPSMRTLGTGATQAAAGNDPRLSDPRVPLAHASTHAGGSDPLTVNNTTATNQANSTGLSVNAAIAAVGVTDPGHTHTINAGGASTNTYRIGYHETFGRINADDRTMGTIDQSVASAVPTSQTAHLRCMDVVFPAGWVGGTVTVNGIGSLGQAVSEVHTMPLGGGTSAGVKSFASVTNYVNSAPAGPGGVSATITNGHKLGVPNFPVVAFIKTTIDGLADSFSEVDLVNGTFDVTGAHVGNHTLEVWYTVDVVDAVSAHTHTMNSATTGVTAADSGHTHGVTDPGHGHTQNAHTHGLTG